MATVAKNVTLSLGLISAAVRVESAVSTTESFKTTCAGQEGKPAHALTAIKQPKKCEHCGELPFNAKLGSAREVSGGLVPVTAAEIAAAKAANDDLHKGKFNLVPHKADEVFALTGQGEKLYQLIPDGESSRYALLCQLIASHPDLAFVAMFTVKTRAAMYVLRARDGVILAEERVAQDRLKPLPRLDTTVNDKLLAMASALLPDLVAPFNATAYEDGYLKAIDAIVSGREVVEVAKVATVTPIRQSDEDLLAALAAMAKPKRKRAPRKLKEAV